MEIDIEAEIQLKTSKNIENQQQAIEFTEHQISLRDYNIMTNTVSLNTNADTNNTLINIHISFPVKVDTKQQLDTKAQAKANSCIDNLLSFKITKRQI